MLVTREGAFVTCLDREMSLHGAHVLQRSQIDALAARHREQKALFDHALAHAQPDDAWAALMGDPLAFDRDDFRAYLAFAPYTVKNFFELLHAQSDLVDHQWQRCFPLLKANLKGQDIALLRKLGRARASLSRLTMLSIIGLPEALPEDIVPHIPVFTSCCGASGATLPAMRAAWSAAWVGKPALPQYKRIFREATTVEGWNDALFALLAIAFRHRSLRAEARKVLEAVPPGWQEWTRLRHEYYLPAIQAAFTHDDTRNKSLVREMAQRYLQLAAERAGVPLPALPDDSCDVALACRLPTDLRLDIELAPKLIPFLLSQVACAPAEALYLPADLARTLRPRWLPEHTLEDLALQKFYHDLRVRPVTREVRPGRNERCLCGSGRKYKVCCGGEGGEPRWRVGKALTRKACARGIRLPAAEASGAVAVPRSDHALPAPPFDKLRAGAVAVA